MRIIRGTHGFKVDISTLQNYEALKTHKLRHDNLFAHKNAMNLRKIAVRKHMLVSVKIRRISSKSIRYVNKDSINLYSSP